MKVTVITISDRASRGIYPDESGPAIEALLKEHFPTIDIYRALVPDEEAAIISAFEKHTDSDYIFTTGGTGISKRDVTPEATQKYCDKELPGIAEVLRAESYKETPTAIFSRGYAGIKGNTIIINFPGSIKAVRLCTQTVLPAMEHGIKMMRGEGH
ncbi:MAG: MogA/MoaB family molybdenum cofactor biosynthesis protein [Spirochaetota bacterium]